MTKPWEDEALLRELYWERGLSLSQVADELGCTYHPVRKNMIRLGIPRRDSRAVAGNYQKRRPAHYRTRENGYEAWGVRVDDNQYTVSVHRLAAVAWSGFETVTDKHVHHKQPIPWLNTEWNLDIMNDGEHKSLHARSRARDSQGRFR